MNSKTSRESLDLEQLAEDLDRLTASLDGDDVAVVEGAPVEDLPIFDLCSLLDDWAYYLNSSAVEFRNSDPAFAKRLIKIRKEVRKTQTRLKREQLRSLSEDFDEPMARFMQAVARMSTVEEEMSNQLEKTAAWAKYVNYGVQALSTIYTILRSTG